MAKINPLVLVSMLVAYVARDFLFTIAHPDDVNLNISITWLLQLYAFMSSYLKHFQPPFRVPPTSGLLIQPAAFIPQVTKRPNSQC
jgi:hypothetical protein